MTSVNFLATFLADIGVKASRTDTALDFHSLFEDLNPTLQCVSRTKAKNQFATLADSDEITVVTSHNRIEEAVVLIRASVLAELLETVARAAVRKTSRRPLMARLDGLKPVPAGHEHVQVRLNSGQRSHRLHVEPELDAIR